MGVITELSKWVHTSSLKVLLSIGRARKKSNRGLGSRSQHNQLYCIDCYTSQGWLLQVELSTLAERLLVCMIVDCTSPPTRVKIYTLTKQSTHQQTSSARFLALIFSCATPHTTASSAAGDSVRHKKKRFGGFFTL